MRTAGVGDLDAIMALEQSSFPTDAWPRSAMAAELASPHCVYLVAEEAGELVGYAGLRHVAGDAQADIQTIAVAASARRRGLGRALLDALVGRAAAAGATELFLDVRADNEPALSLYRLSGFAPIGVRPRYYQPDDVDAIVMRKELS